jgi:hypothetical protein
MNLPVRLNTRVTWLRKKAEGGLGEPTEHAKESVRVEYK